MFDKNAFNPDQKTPRSYSDFGLTALRLENQPIGNHQTIHRITLQTA